ncbi:putative peroxiredoxin [Sphingobium sp. OAS761]|uniref:DsrE/DsrF/DrsH-like family protein n=1 Tax=Sphingobium sp. OAS761 TaxID=2817901 RepID=UPI00209EA76B|nr:DsrE/DsrF/DrsH-like family protein [Sphingobium sp. OAS761]MCP1471504.1 putative peroxiredoxin [Sphingobium sp. OAS761]
MRSLTIAVLTADAERLRGALMLAAAHAASGGRATLFLQLDAVGLLSPPVAAPRDAAHVAAGLPDLATLIAEAMDLGVTMMACQSGMDLCGLGIGDLPDGVTASGPVAFLQQVEDSARLLIA